MLKRITISRYRLRHRMFALRMSRNALASKTGLPRAFVARILAKKSAVCSRVRAKIVAEALECELPAIWMLTLSGGALRRQMRRCGKTTRKLASECYVHPLRIQKFLAGRDGGNSVRFIAALAEVLDCTIEDLID